MNNSNTQFQQHGGHHNAEHPPHGPYWKRMHHSPFFWLAAVSIMIAMTIFILTNNLSVSPGTKVIAPAPMLAP